MVTVKMQALEANALEREIKYYVQNIMYMVQQSHRHAQFPPFPFFFFSSSPLPPSSLPYPSPSPPPPPSSSE